MRKLVRSLLTWTKRHDPNYAALRRGARTAVVLPSLFAICVKLVANLEIATYAAFGSLALLMLVEFTGPMRARLQAQASLSVAGVLLISLGTLVSQTTWLSILTMLVVGFVILFLGVVSSVFASATTSMLLVLTLSIAVPGPTSTVPDRLLGWVIASAAALLAVWLLWPSANRIPLRISAANACRAIAASLRVDVEEWMGAPDFSPDERQRTSSAAHDATSALHKSFLTAPWRPTGLSVASRATVRLVDELLWIDTLVTPDDGTNVLTPIHQGSRATRSAAAAVLAAGADQLDGTVSTSTALASALSELRDELEKLERDAIARAPSTHAPDVSSGDPVPESAESSGEPTAEPAVEEFVNSLEPGFRTQELGSSVALVGTNIDVATAADQRGWLDTLVGNQPGVKSGRFRSAVERMTTHLDWRSVWMHNSVRGAMGLAIAVLIAKEAGLQHSFWVILGTLSVLRSSAVNTGQNALRAVSGTVIGFVIGAALLALVGSNVTVLWFLFPLAVLVAGFAPTALSFAAGQAGFTLTLVILYNLLQPIGWRVGLYRVEDVAIGCAVSIGVGLLLWPSGAAKVLSATLRQAFLDAGAYLVAAVTFDTTRTEGPKSATSPQQQRAESAASGRRLDDAFRTYLAERGSKPLPLAEVTALVRGVAYLRQSADAVVDLWSDHLDTGGARTATRVDLAREATEVQRWYEALGASLIGRGPIPVPADGNSETDQALRRALREDLIVHGGATSSSVRLVWTKDYLDAARRLEGSLVAPAQVAASSQP